MKKKKEERVAVKTTVEIRGTTKTGGGVREKETGGNECRGSSRGIGPHSNDVKESRTKARPIEISESIARALPSLSLFLKVSPLFRV